jgi:hypothetical protein
MICGIESCQSAARELIRALRSPDAVLIDDAVDRATTFFHDQAGGVTLEEALFHFGKLPARELHFRLRQLRALNAGDDR